MHDCLFCKIINGDIPSDTLYSDQDLVVFKDINPVAPTHLLFVSKEHIQDATELKQKHAGLLAKIFIKSAEISEQLGIESGYRIVTNVGEDGGQSVPHLHFHLVAGRPFAWPPG